MFDVSPRRLVDSSCHTGEGPLWHPDEERLYWVDIPAGVLYRYDPAVDEHERCYETDVIGGFTIQADGSLLLFEDGGRVERWHDGDTDVLIDELPRERNSRFNDVVADPRGRVFCGTMPTETRLGRLYRLDTDGTLSQVVDGLDIPNGLGFSPDGDDLYVTESRASTVYRYEYDEETGALANPDVFIDCSDEPGVPDGLAVDEEGYVWSARWDGGCLVRYAPDGTEVRRIEFPARKVSSVTFGGEDRTNAYVTTALGPGDGPPGDRADEGPGAGALFGFEIAVPGLPENRSKIDF
ncbi:SMP-30/gluconolactonase/LRE family protein [Haladaptatus sp. DYSN1]|uniref:SMP-30/gluconolactonase/LRE family protein n=1 Tax=unclassified Haladaptatus TaxID=2622732 RepID=UPI0024067ECC|nr:SMP-30/gluconolactonase/LRE family protein [Haladaptatus sp. DYSN1]